MGEMTFKETMQAIAVAAIASLVFYGIWQIGFAFGQSDVRRHTIIIYEKQFVSGPYYGECATIGEFRACSADKREQKDRHQEGPRSRLGCGSDGGLLLNGIILDVELSQLLKAATIICPPKEKTND